MVMLNICLVLCLLCVISSVLYMNMVVLTGQNCCLGGDQGIKGNMSEIQNIPFGAPPLWSGVPENMKKTFNSATEAVGVGYTPEGMPEKMFILPIQC